MKLHAEVDYLQNITSLQNKAFVIREKGFGAWTGHLPEHKSLGQEQCKLLESEDEAERIS